MTHLEFLVWDRWVEDRWNEPDLQCFYLMQVAAEVRQARYSFAKNPPAVQLKHMKIRFKTLAEREKGRAKEGRELTPEEARLLDLSWAARLGLVGPGAREKRVRREPAPKGLATKPSGATPKTRPAARPVPAKRPPNPATQRGKTLQPPPRKKG